MWTKANAQGVAVLRISYCDTSDKATRSTCADRHPALRPLALVTVTIKGTPFVIVDICLRMLQSAELYKAQGFPGSYIISHGADGKPFTKT